MSQSFSWIPLFSEVAKLLLDWEDRQQELIDFLVKLRSDGLKVTLLNDKDKEGNSFVVKEIDPFTFMGCFNRQIRDDERIAILAEVKKLLGAKSPLPEDFNGVPLLNNQRSWFVSYQATRGKDDVATLWKVFRLAQGSDPLNSEDFAAAFDKAMKVWGTSTNLTMGLFWIRSDTFLNLDTVNREYLKIKLPSGGITSDFYVSTVKRVASEGKPLPEVSHDAWQVALNKDESDDTVEEVAASTDVTGYWLVGAYWGSTDPPDQTQRFKAEGIWQNGYRDKYLDLVRSIQVGDRIAIKSTTTQKKNLPFDSQGKTASKMIIKAIGTVVANRGDGRNLEVEWDPDFEPKEWFFFTFLHTIARIQNHPGYKHLEHSRRLIDFIWGGGDQDYDWYCERWWGSDGESESHPESANEASDSVGVYEPYDIEDIIDSGVFLDRDVIEQALSRLESKKNLILQGAPGVGKTFIARKLAYALLKEKADSRIEMVQFHQTFSYEDFVRGYRPLPEKAGTFGLQDAIFYEFCKRAEEDPDQSYVFIIDEINRGNVSQIFGELLMLIEADKRGPDYAVPLVYNRENEPRFYVPENVYLMGLMNLADRSLAIVDYALRRRFAFLALTPRYDSKIFRSWLLDRKMEPSLVEMISKRMTQLNATIADDPLLGEHYQIGHSFFCPKGDDFSGLDQAWFHNVVDTEIVPLLREYWFDNKEQANQSKEQLKASWS